MSHLHNLAVYKIHWVHLWGGCVIIKKGSLSLPSQRWWMQVSRRLTYTPRARVPQVGPGWAAILLETHPLLSSTLSKQPCTKVKMHNKTQNRIRENHRMALSKITLLSICLPIWLSVYLSISIYLTIYLSIIYLSIYLSTIYLLIADWKLTGH